MLIMAQCSPKRVAHGLAKVSETTVQFFEHCTALGLMKPASEEKAIKAWSFLGGVIGPRWMLEVFLYHWIKDNPEDYRIYKKKRELRAREEKKNACHDYPSAQDGWHALQHLHPVRGDGEALHYRPAHLAVARDPACLGFVHREGVAISGGA